RVVVPQAVVHELVVPDFPACGGFDADQAFAIKPVARTMAAIIVVGRRTHRQIDIAEFLVRTHRRPDVGVASLLPGILFPGLDARLLALRHGVEGPEQTAALDVKTPDIAWRRRPLAPPVE